MEWIKYVKYVVNNRYNIKFYYVNNRTKIFEGKYVLKDKRTNKRYIIDVDDVLLENGTRFKEKVVIYKDKEQTRKVTISTTTLDHDEKHMETLMSLIDVIIQHDAFLTSCRYDRNGIPILY